MATGLGMNMGCASSWGSNRCGKPCEVGEDYCAKHNRRCKSLTGNARPCKAQRLYGTPYCHAHRDR